jgi:hypothetical protein
LLTDVYRSSKDGTLQEKRVMLIKPICQLASRLLKVIENTEVDREGEEIVQSSLLSGGIEEQNLHLFSSKSLR